MIELSQILAAASKGEGRPKPPESPPEVLSITLRETAASYVAPCPFKPGELVTPRANSDLIGAGRPQIVLEVLETPIRNLQPLGEQGGIASHLFGSRLNIRIARESHGEIIANWTESWKLEPYTGPGADPDKAETA